MSQINIPSTHKEDFEKAISILKQAGSTEIYLFGSLAEGTSDKDSDIDIAVKGIPEENFFHIYGKLLTSVEHSLDLVCLDYKSNFNEYLVSKGNLLRVYWKTFG